MSVHSEGRSMFIFLSVLSFFIEGSYDSVVHTFSFSSVCISVKLCLYKVLFFFLFYNVVFSNLYMNCKVLWIFTQMFIDVCKDERERERELNGKFYHIY